MPLPLIGAGIGAGIASSVVGGLLEKDPVDEAKRMADTLYPNTTAYERLGAGGGGVAGAGATIGQSEQQKTSAQTHETMAAITPIAQSEIQAETAKEVAREKNKTDIEIAELKEGRVGPVNPHSKEFKDVGDSIGNWLGNKWTPIKPKPKPIQQKGQLKPLRNGSTVAPKFNKK